MKVLLVRHHDRENVNTRLPESINKAQGVYPPLGIAYIASVLEKAGYAVSIMDSQALNLTIDETKDFISNENPDIVGITSMTPNVRGALEVARLTKEISSDIITVMGGAQLSVFPKETLSFDFIDYGVYGEGEYTMLELVKEIEEGKDLSNIRGLVFKKNRKVFVNRPSMIDNLDELPFPARHLLQNDRYHCVISRQPFTTMITSRGCPFKCGFCFKGPSDKKIRFRSAKSVVDEMEHCKEKFKVKEIMFYDDTFTLNRKHVKDICNEIINRGMDVEWEAPTRVDCVDKEILMLMKNAGCIRLRYGVESGDARILNLMRKKITIEKIEEIFKLTKKVGIETFAYFMIGYVTENNVTIRNTINLAKRLDPDWAMFTAVTPLPFTNLYDLSVEEGLIDPNYWKKFVLGKTNERVPFLVENADEWVNRAYKEFYFRHKFFIKKLFKIRSIDTIRKYLRGFNSIFSFEMKPTENLV
jgi:radical SAM superfamily enzyme YgiQ (UPF0313 family)